MYLINRPRRLRKSPALRQLVRETRLSPSSLIMPLFVQEGSGIEEDISTMPGQTCYSPDTIAKGVESTLESGVGSILLFGVPKPDKKDEYGSGAWLDTGVIQTAVLQIKKRFPEVLIVTDLCLCEYTSHGHCGVLEGEEVNNDKTVELLARVGLSHVQAGADIVAPSDMMDGRVGVVRAMLDQAGFDDRIIMSCAAKYSSAFYSPYREAAGSKPAKGERKSYQLDYHNVREALYESALDSDEGADILMVKPALAYLDVINMVAESSIHPVAAYSVSGEYSMIKAAANAGWINEYDAMCETATSIYRAGADILISYYAKELAAAMKKGDIG